MEEEMACISNGFSFICPGIFDSSLMLAHGADLEESRLSHLIEWSLSAKGLFLFTIKSITYSGMFHRHVSLV